MSSGRRFAVYSLAVLAVALVGSVILVGTVYASNGMVTVRVLDIESGLDLYLPIPGSVLEGIVATGGHLSVFDAPSVRDEIPEFSYWLPRVADLLGAFGDVPDAVLVDVVDGDHHVRIAKRYGSLHVRVYEDGSEVEVSVPIQTARRIVQRLAA